MSAHPLPEIDFSSPDYLEDPNYFFKQYRRHSPIHFLAKYRCWLLSRHADVKQALADPAFSRSPAYSRNAPMGDVARQWTEAGVGFFVDLLSDAQLHVISRQSIIGALSKPQVDALQARIQAVVDEYLEPVFQPQVDLAPILSPVPHLLLTSLLGLSIDEEEKHRFRAAAMSVVPGLLNPNATPAMREQSIASARYLKERLLPEIERRHSVARRDLLAYFVQAVDEASGERSDFRVITTVLMLLVSADTAAYATLYAVKDLFEHREQLALLRARRDLMDNAVKELLRFHTPAGFFPKYVCRETEYQGRRLAPGDAVFICIASANKDETVFEDPETLDLTRDTSQSLSFGFGDHSCLGRSLATALMKAILNKLLDELPAVAGIVSERVDWVVHNGRRAIASLPMSTGL